VKTIVITRKYWGTRSLLNGDTGKMCCLGFACVAYGISKKEMRGIGMPAQLPSKNCGRNKLPKWMLLTFVEMQASDADAGAAADINDDQFMPQAEKEKQLKALFLKHKIRLVFRGKP